MDCSRILPGDRVADLKFRPSVDARILSSGLVDQREFPAQRLRDMLSTVTNHHEIRQDRTGVWGTYEKKLDEELLVEDSNAVVYPGTVMVHFENTTITDGAVMSLGAFKCVASFAPAHTRLVISDVCVFLSKIWLW